MSTVTVTAVELMFAEDSPVHSGPSPAQLRSSKRRIAPTVELAAQLGRSMGARRFAQNAPGPDAQLTLLP